MINLFKNRSPMLWALILMTMLVLAWSFPSARGLIEIAFPGVSLALASLTVVARNRELYRQGKLARGALVGHSLFDVSSLVLAMAAAGWLASSTTGRFITSQAGSGLVTIAVVLAASLLGGIGIGLLMKRIRRRVLAN
jgi:hypothetical protein